MESFWVGLTDSRCLIKITTEKTKHNNERAIPKSFEAYHAYVVDEKAEHCYLVGVDEVLSLKDHQQQLPFVSGELFWYGGFTFHPPFGGNIRIRNDADLLAFTELTRLIYHLSSKFTHGDEGRLNFLVPAHVLVTQSGDDDE